MVCSYVIRTEPGWTSLRVFKCKAGYLSSVSAILLLLRAQLALVNLRSNFTLYLRLRLRRYVMATSGAPPSTSGISNAQLETLMATMRQGIKDELAVMKRELSSEREAADEKLVKKIKLEKAPTFRKKGHEKQFRHNEEVRLKLSEARSALDERPAAVERAKQLLEEGEKIINERQKHIRIADRSDNGWATVEEYVEDELADNEDDEKRLLRADARAGKKLRPAQKIGRGSARKSFPRRGWNFQGPRNSAFLPGSLATVASQFIPTANVYQAAGPVPQQSFSKNPAQVGVSPLTFGPCFECGMPGHYRRYYPKLLNKAPGATSK